MPQSSDQNTDRTLSEMLRRRRSHPGYFLEYPKRRRILSLAWRRTDVLITLTSHKGGVGKTTSSVHLAAALALTGPTLLIDSDPNRSATDWAARGMNSPGGAIGIPVADEDQAARIAGDFEHLVIDTPARPTPENLAALASGCDHLIVCTEPDALSLSAMFRMLESLQALTTRYQILFTRVPPGRAGMDARAATLAEQLPVMDHSIRRLAAFTRAANEGVTVDRVRDPRAHLGWSDYLAVLEEIRNAR